MDSHIDNSYIKFTHNISVLNQNAIILSDNDDSVNKLAYYRDLYIEDLSMINSFEVLSDSIMTISVGETLGFMEISNNHIGIYKKESKEGSKILVDDINTNFSFNKGFNYTIGFYKTHNKLTFYIKKEGVEVLKKEYSIYSQTYKWRMSGSPFIEILKGSVNITQSVISSNYTETPKVSIYGDSFVEGWALVQYGNDTSSKWSTLLANEIGLANCFIEGIGGERISESWFNRFQSENAWFKSKYVIISLGTNNRDVNEYKKYITQTINILKQNNQIPILVTVTPRAGYDFTQTGALINDWIKISGEKYIDMHQAVTNSDDPTSWKDGFVLPDNIHPTIEGYTAMYKQLKSDCPYLIN